MFLQTSLVSHTLSGLQDHGGGPGGLTAPAADANRTTNSEPINRISSTPQCDFEHRPLREATTLMYLQRYSATLPISQVVQ